MRFMNLKVRGYEKIATGRALGDSRRVVLGYRLYLAMWWNAPCSAKIVSRERQAITVIITG